MILLIACEIFKPELEYLFGPGRIDGSSFQVEYLPIRAHNNSADLRRQLQERIDGARGAYRAILLAYGLCGNAVAGLVARDIPLFIPKTHDCSHILLGSAQHSRCFADTPSRGWVTRGNIDASQPGLTFGGDMMSYTLESLQEQYGEEEGEFIWSTIHQSDTDPLVYYIKVPETARPTDVEGAEGYAQKHGKTIQTLEGSLEVLKKLVAVGLPHQNATEDEPTGNPGILEVPPRQAILNTWDNQVIKAGEPEPSQEAPSDKTPR